MPDSCRRVVVSEIVRRYLFIGFDRSSNICEIWSDRTEKSRCYYVSPVILPESTKCHCRRECQWSSTSIEGFSVPFFLLVGLRRV